MVLKYANPFHAQGVWLKGNIHTHTVYSDGELTLEEQTERYRRAGYGFLAVTDHGTYVDTRHMSQDKFTMLQGEELSVGQTIAGTFYHIVALGIGESLPFKEADNTLSPQIVVDYVNKSGGAAVLAHPYWSGLTHGETASLRGLTALEVYNHVCELLNDRGESPTHWDHLLALGHQLNGTAVDDAHNKERKSLPDDSYGGWVMAKTEDNSEGGIIEALKIGSYYSSTGPEIHDVETSNDEIMIHCSPVKKIAFVTMPCLGVCYKEEDGCLTEARYKPKINEHYLRIQITDAEGGRAWTNPIYVEP